MRHEISSGLRPVKALGLDAGASQIAKIRHGEALPGHDEMACGTRSYGSLRRVNDTT